MTAKSSQIHVVPASEAAKKEVTSQVVIVSTEVLGDWLLSSSRDAPLVFKHMPQIAAAIITSESEKACQQLLEIYKKLVPVAYQWLLRQPEPHTAAKNLYTATSTRIAQIEKIMNEQKRPIGPWVKPALYSLFIIPRKYGTDQNNKGQSVFPRLRIDSEAPAEVEPKAKKAKKPSSPKKPGSDKSGAGEGTSPKP